MAPYLAFFAAGRFEVARGTQRRPALAGRRVPGSWRRRRGGDRMELMEQDARASSHWLETRLGDYPFAPDRRPDHQPPARASRWRTRPGRRTPLGVGPSTVVHELAHQWFGDSVVGARAGATSGSTRASPPSWRRRTPRSTSGQDAQKWLEQTWEAFPEEDPYWMLPIGDPGPENIFAWPVYTRGSMTLQALRHRVVI